MTGKTAKTAFNPHHDMGGQSGGPVIPDKADDPIFEQPWHKRVLGLTVAAGGMGVWNIDMSRFRRENLPQQDYQHFTYYEKWLAALTNLFVVNGFVSRDELIEGYQGPLQPIQDNIMRAPDVAAILARGAPSARPYDGVAKFTVGARVTTRHPVDTLHADPGHTRLPLYAANKTGVVLFTHGAHALPNSNAHQLGETPEPLYAVEFMAADLWPDSDTGHSDTVIIDCWESYLETA